MQNHYHISQYGHRHQSPQQHVDASRQQYSPFPPPPNPSTPGGGSIQQGILLPPPPPRRFPSQTPTSALPPPPPPTAPRQSTWARQQTYYSPPPPPAPYNPGAYSNYQYQDSQPLTSATYIPSGESLVPGVGIPPLDFGVVQNYIPDCSNFLHTAEPHDDRSLAKETDDGTRNPNVHELGGNVQSGHSQRLELPTPTSAVSEQQAIEWPLERVLSWLSKNGYSSNWQETFQTLGVHGSQFLEIGQGKGGKGSLSIMHNTIYPHLAKQCTKSGSGWDQSREQEEGRRLRRDIRAIKRSNGQSPPNQQTSSDSNEIAHDAVNPPPNGADDGVLSLFAVGIGEEAQNYQGQQSMANSPQDPPSAKAIHPDLSVSSIDQDKRTHEQNENTLRQGDQATQNSLFTEDRTTSNGLAPGSSSATNQPQPNHARGHSSDSNTTRSVSQSRSLWPENEVKPSTTDLRRPSNGEHNSKFDPAGFKEHRNIFKNLFARGVKREDGLHSPEEPHSHSPSSPVNFRLSSLPYVGRQNNNSDPTLQRTSSKRAMEESHPASASAAIADLHQVRKYVMVTPDGWNFRLVNVTGVTKLQDFVATVVQNLSLSDTGDFTFSISVLGQENHGETLSAHQLEEALQTSDEVASLKLLVRDSQLMAPGSITASSFPEFARAEQPHFAQDGSISSKWNTASAEELEELKSADVSHTQDTGTISSILTDGETVLEKDKTKGISSKRERLAKDLPGDSSSPHVWRGSRVINFDLPRTSPFADSFPEYLVPHRKAPPVPPDTSTLIKANSLSRRQSMVPRQSWTDSQDSLFKINSIDDHSGESSLRDRRKAVADHPPTVTGIAGALAGAGRISGLIGAPQAGGVPSSLKEPLQKIDGRDSGKDHARALANINFNPARHSPGSPRSPGITMSKGNVQFKIPEYEDDREPDQQLKRSPAISTMPHRIITNLRKVPSDLHPSPDVSPSTQHPQKKLVSRASTRRGPQLDFRENRVSFERTVAEEPPESDEDSDDGLFAVPLESVDDVTRPSIADDAISASTHQTEIDRSTEVAIPTKPRQFAKDRDPRGPTQGGGWDAANPLMKSTDSPDDDEKTARYNIPIPRIPKRSPTLEQKMKANNRQSFISDDWAPRPAPEALVEHLDDFFPNVDLDQPSLIEEDAEGRKKEPSRDAPSETYSNKGTPMSDGEAPKLRSTAVNELAIRQIRRAGALSRTKSIREVVRGAYQHPNDRFSVFNPRLGTVKGTDINRRQSTKMFGAKIEQIKPPRGSRLFPRDAIPEATVTQDRIDTIPHRERTFKWVKGELIGKGSFGRVYLGMNTTTGELLAVKQVEVNPKTAGQDKDKVKEMVKSMNGEIDTMQHLDHVNIVQYLGCERKEYSISIFLEYISGGSIGSCLRKHGKFEESVVASLTRQILCGLAYLHDEGILHRDLKADNILLDVDGTCKISDFGISKKTDNVNIYGNDATNGMQGSVFWMAPEVVGSSVSGYSAKVDIWSLGCVVLEMFTGKRPWAKEEVIGAIYKLGSLHQAPPIPDSESIGLAGLSFMYDCFQIDERDRPTAGVLMRSPFCNVDPNYNFIDTELYAKIKPKTKT